MSITVKLRRGTTTQHSTFTGEEAEVTVDTTKDVVVVHDGITAGGHPMVKASALATVAFSGDYNDLVNLPSGTLLTTTDIGVTVQGYNANTVIDASYVHTDNNYTTTEQTKLAGIAAGAEVNVNADWNAISGDSQILNKPTLGTAAAAATTDFATAAQGTLADSAVQPSAIANMLETSDIGVTVQGYSAVLAGTTASFTTAGETKLDGIAAGAEVNVNADWTAVSGDAQILNKPTAVSTFTNDAGYLTSYTETDPIVGAVNGLVKANGAGTISAAVAGTDYLAPAAIGTTVQAYDVDLTAWAGVATSAKQDTLVSGTNIKTINGSSLLGSGDLAISGGGGASALTISNKTAAYTVVAGDLGTIINCTTGTFTVSLTAAATLGAGFNCWIWNSGSGVITIDPSGSETIEGRATLPVYPGSGIQLVCTGINWSTMDGRAVAGIAWNMSVAAAPPFATGLYAIAIGGNSTASGQRSLAIGLGNIASSISSTAIGYNSGGFGSQAVTGSGAMALGGSYASGTDSFAAAVANNTSTYGARGASSVALGYLANVSSNYAIAIGANASATGTNSLAIGGFQYGGPSASGVGSVVIGCNYNLSNPSAAGPGSMSLHDGSSTTSAASNSLAIQGGTARVIGQFAYGGGEVGSTAQTSIYLPKADTTNGTPKVLVNNRTTAGAAAGTNNQVILTNNSAYAFSGIVVAKQSGSTNAAAWKVEGLIVRGANAASTTLVFSTVMAISNVPLWTLALSADTTNGGLAVTATGAAATNIRWVATIQTSEVTYA